MKLTVGFRNIAKAPKNRMYLCSAVQSFSQYSAASLGRVLSTVQFSRSKLFGLILVLGDPSSLQSRLQDPAAVSLCFTSI
jgi:hypothetical protein